MNLCAIVLFITNMHNGNSAKIKVRQALASTLAAMRAAGADVEVIDEAWKLEKQFRAEMAELQKQEIAPELALASHHHHDKAA